MSSEYENVFLCIKKDITHFECQKFNSFIEADKFFRKNYKNIVVTSTMITVFKYFPTFVQDFILNHKLKNLFVKSKIIK